MFNVIRIPTKFTRGIKRLSKNDRLELFDYLLEIGAGNPIELPDNLIGDNLSLIYGEWMNMEAKNGNKPKESLIIDSSEGLAQVNPSNPIPRVEESRIEYIKVEESKTSEIKIYEDSSFEYIITKLFIDKHKEVQNASFIYLYNKEGEDVLIQKWSDVVRKLKQIDKYTEEQIGFIIRYLFTNQFWVENISSMEKLRKKDTSGVPYFVLLINEAKKEKQGSIAKDNGYNGVAIVTDEF